MTDIASVKSTRKTITKIKALTKRIVHSAEYWNSSAGWSLNFYNQKQGNDGLARKIGRLRGQVRKAEALSYSLSDEARSVIRQLCDTTLIVVECCQHFPRDCEWPGLPHLREQRALIELARAILRSVK